MSQKSEPSRCSPEVVSDCARMLVGSYRRNDAEDPGMFIRAAATVLSHYPEDIVRRVTHPAHGIPSRLKFLPSIAEIREACEAEMKPIYEARNRQLRAEREKRLLEAPAAVTPEQRERAVKRWYEEIRPSMIPAASATVTKEQAADHLMSLAGLTPDQFAAIPDAPAPRSTFQNLKG